MQDYPTKSNLLSPDVYSGVKMVKIALTAWVSLGGHTALPILYVAGRRGPGGKEGEVGKQ